MAKLDLYRYKGEGVVLEFSFEQGAKNSEQKLAFLQLLREAIKDLEKDLADL